jgi:predicted dehydrogenase
MTTPAPAQPEASKRPSRRTFIRNSSLLVAGGAVAGQLSLARSAHAINNEELKIGLIGCGGRGTGAVANALTTKGPLRVITMADAFQDNIDRAINSLSKGENGDKIDVPPERQFTGFDAYQQVLATDIDVVILATPPGFRPLHFAAAIDAGKHVFMEKPVAVDAAGVRKVLAANEQAKQKDLAVAVGLQRHHDPRYIDTVKRIQDGVIGDLILARAYWNGGGVWTRPRQPDQTEMEYQMRNWYYFNWLCGDHIVEQHIHNLDVINWIKNGYPVSAQGQGGRQVRTGPEHGEIYDHHFVEFTYADGTKMLSQCRHIRGTWNSVSEHVHGTKGTCDVSGFAMRDASGEQRWRSDAARVNPYDQEHEDLFAMIRSGNITYNEGEFGALSTMTSILGRMCTYSGEMIKWDDALNSELVVSPVEKYHSFEDTPPVTPREDGTYAIPTPGLTKTV